MTIFATDRDDYISQLLETTLDQLDITEEEFESAERCYHDLGKHLASADAEVYVQGSVLLGTVVRPLGGDGEYDLDLVAKLDVKSTSITQAELKERIGGLLSGYHADHDGTTCHSPSEVTEGRRSWCLHYDGFHMDVLPCIPDAETSPTAIKLTDKLLTRWQPSDPLAYVNWFREQCAKQLLAKSIELSHKYGSVEKVPKHRVRTPLHRVVQILKRHRDIYFKDDTDGRPPSSLITTLAALSYQGEGDLLKAALHAVQRMPDHVEKRDGKYIVANPVSDENFADKWNDYPERQRKFEEWRAAVERDLIGFWDQEGGRVLLHNRVGEAFGNDPLEKAVRVLGQRTNAARQDGTARMGAGGVLTSTATGITIPNHRNFGGPAPR